MATRSAGGVRSAGSDGAATVVLTALTVIAASGLGRVLGGFSRPVLVGIGTAVAVHALAWVWRRLSWRVPALACLGAVVLVGAWVLLPQTTLYGLPTLETLRAASARLADLADVRQVNARAVTLASGFPVLLVVVVGFSAYLSDHAAFRMGSPLMGLLPAFTLFVGGTAPNRGDTTAAVVVAFATGAIAALAALRWSARRAGAGSFEAPRPPGPLRVLPAAAVLGLVALGAMAFGGPLLPGAGRPGLIGRARVLAPEGFTTTPGSMPGGTGSLRFEPFVDIRDRLGPLSDVELFTVAADLGRYWRLTALDAFDGARWSAATPSGPEPMPGADVATTRLVQDVQIGAMVTSWLPAAYRPITVRGASATVERASGTLTTQSATTMGRSYQVVSELLSPNGVELGSVTSPDPAIPARYRQLPGSVSNRFRAEARRVAGTGAGPYQAALALQRYFRETFVYDLAAGPGQSAGALDRFVFETRRGFCEQFAAAFAAMARAVGLPARVAVGFTPGRLEADGRYHVRGLNAHAWPEVHFAGVGWVAFEPTPGRGQPGSEGYTGVPAAQAEPAQTPPSTATVPTTGPRRVPPPSASTAPTSIPDAAEPTVATTVPAPGAGPTPDRGAARVGVPVGAGLGVLALVTAVPVLKAVRRRRRRARARTPDRKVLVSWLEATEALAASGLGRGPAETIQEHAARASSARSFPRTLARPLGCLAEDAADAAYSGEPVGADQVRRAGQAAVEVEDGLRRARRPLARLGTRLDPRPLWMHRPPPAVGTGAGSGGSRPVSASGQRRR